MKNQLKNSAFAIICAIALSACGGNSTPADDANKPASTTQEDTTVAPATEAPTTANSFVVEANDQMKYNVSELKAVAGKEITIELKNVGKMEKSVMGHNLVVLKAGTDIPEFAKKAMAAKDSDYIPASEATVIIAHTKLLGAGESDTIKFTITEKGTYDFICSFPGHYALMHGKIIVE